MNSPHTGQWRGALMFSLICAWTNSGANNGDAGDFRRHCAHYGVILIIYPYYTSLCDWNSRNRNIAQFQWRQPDELARFTTIFPLTVSSPNTVYKLMGHNNQLPVVWQYLTNIAAVQNVAVLKQIWLFEIIGSLLLMCRNTTMRVYGSWIKYILRFMFKNI